MNIRDTIQRAVDPSRPKKSPVHLLLIPVAFCIMGFCTYGFVVTACAFAAFRREEILGFSSYGEPAKIFIVVPMLLASIPVGFLVSNVLVWSILPFRRFLDREARGREGGSFAESMRGLRVFSKYWVPAFLAIGFGAAFLGR